MPLVENFGYFGVFLANFIGSATVFFPLPASFLVVGAGAVLNPWIVAVFAALGASFGELTGYGIGFAGSKLFLAKKYPKLFNRGMEWFQNGKGFLFVVIFAATPMPDDLTGLIAGMLKYNLKKFLLASFLGKLIMNFVLAFAGFYGVNWIFDIFKLNF